MWVIDDKIPIRLLTSIMFGKEYVVVDFENAEVPFERLVNGTKPPEVCICDLTLEPGRMYGDDFFRSAAEFLDETLKYIISGKYKKDHFEIIDGVKYVSKFGFEYLKKMIATDLEAKAKQE